MATPSLVAFERAFPRREYWRGAPRTAVLWSLAAALCLALLLITAWLFLDLLVTRGQLKADVTEAADREALQSIWLSPNAMEFQLSVDGRETATLENTGILPSVWKLRGAPGGRLVAAAYRNASVLQSNRSALVALLAAAAVFGLLRAICLTRASLQAESAGSEVAMSLRRMIHRQALRLGPGDLRESSGAQALQLFLADVDLVRRAVATTVSRIARYPIELLILFLVALACHWRMTLLCLLPLLGAWWLVHLIRRRSERANQLQAVKADAELRRLAESFRTTRLVRGFSMETWEHDQFQKHLDRFRQNLGSVSQRERGARWASRTVALICLVLVAFLLGSKVLQSPDDLPVSKAGLLLLTVIAMFRPLEQLRQIAPMQQDASLAADRIFRYIDQIPEVSQAVGARFLNPLSKSLRFENVTYSLPKNRKLLDRFDLTITAGEAVSIASFDPLETRAIAHLLPRFIDPQAGRILIDNEDTTLATLESLRAETIYVSADDPFFTGTVLENITCGAAYTLPDVTAAAKTSHAHNFIQKLPQGYETVLGQHGEQLDAGQSFRLSLARAILRNPALLIIEEPVDLLDEDTKALLEDAYNRVTRGRTVIFLPSRLSTVRRCDRVVFLHRGRVEAAGQQQELLQASPLYRHWEYVNFNEFRSELEPAGASA